MSSEAKRLEAVELLRALPLLQHVEDDTVRALLANADYFVYDAAQFLLQEGQAIDAMFFLLRGMVRVAHIGKDDCFTPKLLVAPSQFGQLEFLARRANAAQSVRVVDEAWIAAVPWTVVRERLCHDHGFALAMLEDLSVQFLHTADAAKQMAFGGLTARVVNVLLSYADAGYLRGDGGERSVAAINHTQLAYHVASPRRSVLRVMRDLQREGLVSHDERGVVIRNIGKLEAKLHGDRVGLTHRAVGATLRKASKS